MELQPEDDIALLKRDDEKTFLRIYNTYWESLYAMGVNRLRSTDEVEDIVQEIFTDLWNRRKTIRIRDNFKTYLFTAMKYKVIDHIRKRKDHKVRLDAISSSERLAINSTSEILSFNELYERLKEGVDQLPERCKLVFKMSRELDMSAAEISRELKVSKRTVETQIYKSLTHLKKHLNDYPVTLWIFAQYLVPQLF